MADNDYPSAKSAAVVHNAANQRFETDVDGQLSVLEYTFKNHRIPVLCDNFNGLNCRLVWWPQPFNIRDGVI
jgi:hypothetical protein